MYNRCILNSKALRYDINVFIPVHYLSTKFTVTHSHFLHGMVSVCIEREGFGARDRVRSRFAQCAALREVKEESRRRVGLMRPA